MRFHILALALSLIAIAGTGVAPGNGNGGPPEQFPGPGEFPGNPPDLPDRACENVQNYPPANVPGWVNLPGCSE